MLAIDIMDMARQRLGDVKKHRWTDERLLTIVSQGQEDICKLANVYRRERVIPLVKGQTRYSLPDDCVVVKRVEYKDKKLPLHSKNDLDDPYFKYTSELIALKDHLNMTAIDIYPAVPDDLPVLTTIKKGLVLSDTFTVTPIYGVGTNTSEPYSITPAFGVVTGSEDDKSTFDDSDGYGDLMDSTIHQDFSIYPSHGNYGVTTEITYDMGNVNPNSNLHGFNTNSKIAEINGQFGIVTDVVSTDGMIRVFYQAVPRRLVAFSSGLVLAQVWEAALLRYVVGTALQDDNDANNLSRGEAELQKYTAELLKARELGSKDFSSGTNDKMFTRHRRI